MKTIIIICLIIIVLSCAFVFGHIGINYIADALTSELTNLKEAIESDSDYDMEVLNEKWEKYEDWLLVLVNHEDVDQIAITIMQFKQDIEFGDMDFAAKKIDLAIFQISDIPKKEVFNIVNIF